MTEVDAVPDGSTGPTQSYDAARERRWVSRKYVALAVRTVVMLLPLVASFACGLLVERLVPGHLGLGRRSWVAVSVVSALVVYWLVARAARRLLPLSALLRLSLVFPDRAPSRFRTATRTLSARALQRRLDELAQLEDAPGIGDDRLGDLLALFASLSTHDASTARHSERVMVYSSLLADDLGLPEQDAVKLRWAALLHDVGKIKVPSHILNKAGRPTADEWYTLCTHPEEGMTLAAPLADFLGPWINGIGQHHERWDGAGYPNGIAGEDIDLAARIIAVADTFDVITSARSYKRPLSSAHARAEIAACAGTQFDPRVTRSLLSVGLGRFRLLAGASVLTSALPGLRDLLIPASVGRALAQAALAVVATALVGGVAHSATAPGTSQDGAPTAARRPSTQPGAGVGAASSRRPHSSSQPSTTPGAPAPSTGAASTPASGPGASSAPPGAPAPSASPSAPSTPQPTGGTSSCVGASASAHAGPAGGSADVCVSGVPATPDPSSGLNLPPVTVGGVGGVGVQGGVGATLSPLPGVGVTTSIDPGVVSSALPSVPPGH